jgi:hypothetical protein
VVRNIQRWKRALAITFVMTTLLGAGAPGHAEGPHTVPAPKAALQPIARAIPPDDPLIDPVSEQGQKARGN